MSFFDDIDEDINTNLISIDNQNRLFGIYDFNDCNDLKDMAEYIINISRLSDIINILYNVKTTDDFIKISRSPNFVKSTDQYDYYIDKDVYCCTPKKTGFTTKFGLYGSVSTDTPIRYEFRVLYGRNENSEYLTLIGYINLLDNYNITINNIKNDLYSSIISISKDISYKLYKLDNSDNSVNYNIYFNNFIKEVDIYNSKTYKIYNITKKDLSDMFPVPSLENMGVYLYNNKNKELVMPYLILYMINFENDLIFYPDDYENMITNYYTLYLIVNNIINCWINNKAFYTLLKKPDLFSYISFVELIENIIYWKKHMDELIEMKNEILKEQKVS